MWYDIYMTERQVDPKKWFNDKDNPILSVFKSYKTNDFNDNLYITFNLYDMIKEGLKNANLNTKYESIYDLLNEKQWKDIVEDLELLCNELEGNPDLYNNFNPENGWWNYKTLIHGLSQTLNILQKNPDYWVTVYK